MPLLTLFSGAAGGTYLGYKFFSPDDTPAQKFAKENAAAGIGVQKISTTRIAVIGALSLGAIYLLLKAIR